MEGALNRDPYSQEWFKKRAFDSLHQINEHDWDFSDSLLLYTPGSEDEYVTRQETETDYSRMVTVPERRFIEAISEQLVRELPDHFEYIDLGPGSEHKEQFLFDAAKKLGKTFTYRPVDISARYLKLSAEHAQGQGIAADPIRSSFEDLPQKLGQSSVPRFISLGLTYSNYEPEQILALLKSIASEGGTAFVNAQIRDRINLKTLVGAYSGDTYKVFDSKMRLIGLDPENDISKKETDDGVRVWYTVGATNPELDQKGVRPGDRLMPVMSLRPTEDKLKKDTQAVFPNSVYFDTGESFIGTLLK